MALFQGMFFFVMGALLLLVTYQSLSKGWLLFGSNGLKGRLIFRKDDNPLGFWAAFCLYSLCGFALTIYALLILAGICPPLPLRRG